MSKVIRNGTIVTHDLTYQADIRIEGGIITEIGKNLKGDNELDASGCYVMPGGLTRIRILKCRSWGRIQAMILRVAPRAALAGGTTMVVDFALQIKAKACWTRSKDGTINPRARIAISRFTWR